MLALAAMVAARALQVAAGYQEPAFSPVLAVLAVLVVLAALVVGAGPTLNSQLYQLPPGLASPMQ